MKNLIWAILATMICSGCIGDLDLDCENLKSGSKDRELMQKIWHEIVDLVQHPEALQLPGVNIAMLHVRDLKGDLGIDWEALGIAKENATVQFSGSGFSYHRFEPSSVDEVILGNGLRELLIFRIDRDVRTVEDLRQETPIVTVDCR